MSSEGGDNEVDFCFALCNKKDLSTVWPEKSVYVVEEIINTEQAYVTDLENIVKGYMEPFSHHPCVKSSSNGDLTVAIFSNVSDLLFFHRTLLSDMVYYSKEPAEYGDVFLQHENNFSHYKEYCKNFPEALRTLKRCMDDKTIASFVMHCQQRLNHMMPLEAMLIKPIQRIMKYHLLLQNITKHLTPNFQGFTNLCKAHSVMMKVAADINETQRLYEASIRVQEIESCLVGWKGKKLCTYGNVLLEDFLKVIGFKGLRYVIVFEKLLLLLKKVPKDNVKYHYKGHIEGNEVSVMATPIQNHPFCFKVFSISNRDHYYLLETRNEDDKMKWMATLVSLIETDLSLLSNDTLIRTGALPPPISLPEQDATGSRKRSRPSHEDENIPGLKQREVLSDQSNIANDIGPAAVTIVPKRHYAVKKKISVQSDQTADKAQAGIVDKSNISDVIPQEAASNAKLLEYSTLHDENSEVTPLVEPSDHGSLQWPQATSDDEYPFARTHSMAFELDQEEEKSSNYLQRQHEDFKSLDLDIERRFRSSMHHWEDMTNLAELKDDSVINEANVSGDTSASSDKKPKSKVENRDSVFSASSLESFTLDEHGNLNRQFSDYDKMRSGSSSNRSSCVDINDIVLTADPSMFTITEETDGVTDSDVYTMEEATKGIITVDKSNEKPSEDHVTESLGDDEVDFHYEEPTIPSLSFDTGHIKISSPIKSSDSDSEEEVDPSIHDSLICTSNISSSDVIKDSTDQHSDSKNTDMFVTASGRFIAPTSTLPRMRRSITLVGKSPYSLDSTPDSPSVSALARKRFRLVSRSFEMCSDDETQSTGADKDDDDEEMDHCEDFSSPSSLPTTPIKLQRSQSVRGAKSHSMMRKSPRRTALRRSGGHTDLNSIISPPTSLKTGGQEDSFAVKNLAPVFDEIRGKRSDITVESNSKSFSTENVQKGSCDTMHLMSSMNTSEPINVDNPPFPPPEPFQFTAHSLPTTKTEVLTNSTSTPDLASKTSIETNGEKFSTPDNQSNILLIQPLSQSPHVPGKTPHGANVMTRSKLFTSTPAPVPETTNLSQSHHAGVINALSQDTPANVDNELSITSNTSTKCDSMTELQNQLVHNLAHVSSDSKDVINENKADTNVVLSAVKSVDEDKDMESTTKTICTDNNKDDAFNDANYIQLDAAGLVKEQSDVINSEVLMASSDVLPVLVIPETTDQTITASHDTLSDDTNSSSFDPLSPLTLSLSKSPVLQQVVDSDKSAQFPVTPNPFHPYKNTTQSASLLDQMSKSTDSLSPSKIQDFTHLQAPTDKKHSRRRQPVDPYAVQSQGGRLVRSLEYTPVDSSQRNETQLDKSPKAISPSLKHSRSLGDVVTPKLKSVSTPSTPATDVSFELPPENVVLQGRVSSFSMHDSNEHPMLNEFESSNTVKPMAAFNTECSINITTDEVSDDDNDDSAHDESSPLISKRQSSQPKTRKRPRSKYLVAPGGSYNSMEETQRLLEEGDEDGNMPKTASSSWSSNLSVRSVITYLINLGIGIGNVLLYYISGVFRPRTEATNAHNNHIN